MMDDDVMEVRDEEEDAATPTATAPTTSSPGEREESDVEMEDDDEAGPVGDDDDDANENLDDIEGDTAVRCSAPLPKHSITAPPFLCLATIDK